MYEMAEGARTLTNTPRDTPNDRIPNWNARKASNGVRSVRGSPVINIRSLGDIVNKPARASSLGHEKCEVPTRTCQGDRTDKVNAANDQAVMVPSASSASIAAVGGTACRGLSGMSRSSKLSAIWNVVGRSGMWLQIKRRWSTHVGCDRGALINLVIVNEKHQIMNRILYSM